MHLKTKAKKENIEKIGEKAYDSVFAVFLESFKLTGKAKEPTPAPLALPDRRHRQGYQRGDRLAEQAEF